MHLNIILPDRCCSKLPKVNSFEQALQFKTTSALNRFDFQWSADQICSYRLIFKCFELPDWFYLAGVMNSARP